MLETASEVTEALESAQLVPPTAPASLGNGTTRELRDAMARFSNGPNHTSRRAQVTSAIDRIDAASLAASAIERTAVFVRHREQMGVAIDARQLGLQVPTEALATLLGTPEPDLEAVARDVELIVQSIGRGEPVTAATDAAANQLISRFDTHPDGAVAAISLLYQMFDSTAALLSSVLLSEASSDQRRNALAGTIRSAQCPVTVGSHSIGLNETVRVSLEGEGFEFGHGPHRCPGVELAYAILAGITHSLEPFDLALHTVDHFTDGRAASLPMTRRRATK